MTNFLEQQESEDTKFKCQLDFFEGPLDLLLYLIKKNEIDINNICLEKITNQYIEYLTFMKSMNIDLASEFVVTAATLLHIKTKWLLPNPEAEEEDDQFDDPRLDLLEKLLEYKKFKEAAGHLEELHQRASLSWGKGKNNENKGEVQAATVFDAGIFDLFEAYERVLKRNDFKSNEVFAEHFKVSDKIDELRELLAIENNILFSHIIHKMQNKDEIVCFFLAMLELVKLQEIKVKQNKRVFGEIAIIRA